MYECGAVHILWCTTPRSYPATRRPAARAAAPTPAAAAPTRQPSRPPLRWSHLQLRPGQSLHPRQPLVKGGADSMNVAFYRIYGLLRNLILVAGA